jgi:hypothetical protein
MQTIQMIGGRKERGAFLSLAAAALLSGGRLACAVIDQAEMDEWSLDDYAADPQIRVVDGVEYISQPTGVKLWPHKAVLSRIRTRVDGGHSFTEPFHVTLARLTPRDLELEAKEHGLIPDGRRRIAGTDDLVPATVVVLRKP